MDKEQNKKWYPVEYEGFWQIQTEPFYDSSGMVDVLNVEHVGEEQAEKNARLCAMAPELLELVGYQDRMIELLINWKNIDTDERVRTALSIKEMYKDIIKQLQ